MTATADGQNMTSFGSPSPDKHGAAFSLVNFCSTWIMCENGSFITDFVFAYLR